MSNNIFGNLREWERVPHQMMELIRDGKLDEHQAELVRMLRYTENWRLRESVLRIVKCLRVPSNELLMEILRLLENEDVYFEMRLLAVEAIEDVLTRKDTTREEERRGAVCFVAEQMESLLNSAGPPILQDALQNCLATIQTES